MAVTATRDDGKAQLRPELRLAESVGEANLLEMAGRSGRKRAIEVTDVVKLAIVTVPHDLPYALTVCDHLVAGGSDIERALQLSACVLENQASAGEDAVAGGSKHEFITHRKPVEFAGAAARVGAREVGVVHVLQQLGVGRRAQHHDRSRCQREHRCRPHYAESRLHFIPSSDVYFCQVHFLCIKTADSITRVLS